MARYHSILFYNYTAAALLNLFYLFNRRALF